MKKIIIAFAAIALAVTVNAAACAWSGSAIALSTTAGAGSATSYALYLLDASVTSAADMGEYLANGDTSKIAAATVETTSGIAVGTTTARWNKSSGSYDAGTTVTYYTVIFNNSIDAADQFMITAEKTATAPGTGNLSMAFGTQAANTWTTMAVPEPTSGLLLLLGMAGLALKRKQA